MLQPPGIQFAVGLTLPRKCACTHRRTSTHWGTSITGPARCQRLVGGSDQLRNGQNAGSTRAAHNNLNHLGPWPGSCCSSISFREWLVYSVYSVFSSFLFISLPHLVHLFCCLIVSWPRPPYANRAEHPHRLWPVQLLRSWNRPALLFPGSARTPTAPIRARRSAAAASRPRISPNSSAHAGEWSSSLPPCLVFE